MLRFLRYDQSPPVAAGMNHQLSNLECLVREAHVSGRLAVLPPLNLTVAHNFGVRRQWAWASYFDLGASYLVDATGRKRRLPIARGVPAADVRTLTLAPGESMPAAAHDYPLIVRRIEQGLFRRDVPDDARPPLSVRACNSVRVRELSQEVVDDLRTRGAGRFVAVHVRRGDRLGQYPRHLTEPAGIRRHLNGQGVPDNSLVFFLSDERDPDFWRALRFHYEVVRYTDYPQLAELVRNGSGHLPDNYLLYEVEKQVMRSAATRVETLPVLGQGQTHPHSTLVDRRTWSRIVRRRRNPIWVRLVSAIREAL